MSSVERVEVTFKTNLTKMESNIYNKEKFCRSQDLYNVIKINIYVYL